MALTTRPGTVADVDWLLADVQAGFDSYTAFAPFGWRAPDMSHDRERTEELLRDPGTWVLLASVDDERAGHVGFFPARERGSADAPAGPWDTRPLIAGLAHLWQLFILPRFWGAGVAAQLHDAAIDEMQARGFHRARLFTPALHARARRFYERRAWRTTGEEWNDELALMLAEYARTLD
jgi:GNAT superfamily N-acetyltransferase